MRKSKSWTTSLTSKLRVMNEVLFHTMIDKVDAHERKIEQLQEKIEQLPDHTETLNLIKSREDEILSDIKKIFFLEKEMRELSATMVTGLITMVLPNVFYTFFS
jgi:uncharacterized coiled-coil DUF342 family protein